MNNIAAYLITTTLVFLTVGAAIFIIFSLRVSIFRFLSVFSANLALALLFLYFVLRFTENKTYLDIAFLLSCLSILLTAQLCFSEAFAAKLILVIAAYICEGIISLSLYVILPLGYGFLAAILTQIIAIVLVGLSLAHKDKLNHALGTIPPKTLLPFIFYGLLTLAVLQIRRREIIDLDLITAYFIILLSAMLFIFMILALYKSALHSITDNEKQLLSTIEEAERRNYQLLLSSVETLRIANHDFRHHLRTVKGFLQHSKKDEALSYLDVLENEADKHTHTATCLNPSADAIIQYYIELCKVGGIEFEHHFVINDNLSINDTDLCACLSNCLENAIIAVLKLDQNTQERKIRGIAFERQNNLIIKIENSFYGHRQSFKEGVGTASLKRIAAKYNGSFTTEIKENTFISYLILRMD